MAKNETAIILDALTRAMCLADIAYSKRSDKLELIAQLKLVRVGLVKEETAFIDSFINLVEHYNKEEENHG